MKVGKYLHQNCRVWGLKVVPDAIKDCEDYVKAITEVEADEDLIEAVSHFLSIIS